MKQLCLKLLFCSIIVIVYSSGIEEKVKQYFNNDVFKAFQKHWQAHRRSFENAILLVELFKAFIQLAVYVRVESSKLNLSLVSDWSEILHTGSVPIIMHVYNIHDLMLLLGLAPDEGTPRWLTALKENYGYRGMNVYVRRSADSLKLCTGFYATDNVIELLLIDLTLTSLPHLTMPEVTFALASNVLRVEARLSKMIMEAEYTLFRNQSDIEYSAIDGTLEKSPFSYQQVQPRGQLAVIAEDCTLVGFIIAKLSGHVVNLGHDTFRVSKCKFHVEISSYRQGETPVIAPYFSVEQSKQLELMMTKPIRAELLPKLQAAVFTYINTSLIFGDYLPKFREYQNNIFKETLKHMNKIVREINNETVKANDVTMSLEPSEVSWTSTSSCSGDSCYRYILVDNVTVYGLDTLYSSHTGGPYKLQFPRIAEALRFHSLMVRGSLYFVNDSIQRNHDFVAEIHDVAVEFEIDMDKAEPKIEVLNWRSFEFSIIEMENHENSQKYLDAFIQAYLINKLPNILKDHITSMYNKWLEKNHKEAGNIAPSNSTICINVNNNETKK